MREPATTTNARLDALPRKVSAPLRELLAVGQIDEEILGTVLDAAELAGSPMKALGFAVGFMYLQSQRVPVKDVIRMARAQRRRIRLDWSARRWQQEHDRLSRAETLKRLREENVHYDMAEATASLPAHFRGYLIPSSRRLGMEGLRQRHCVAGYHAQIQAGYCVVASVFIDRERWTVQLARTGDEEAPLRIVQIRSRFNKVPTREIREAIHRELAIPLEPRTAAHDADVDEARPHAYMGNLRRILPVLRENGVRRVTVRFDGSGDSGSIDDVEYGDAAIDGSVVMVEIEVLHRVFQAGQWVTSRVLEQKDLNTAIEELTDDYLAETNEQRRRFRRADHKRRRGHRGAGSQCSLHGVLNRVFMHSGHRDRRRSRSVDIHVRRLLREPPPFSSHFQWERKSLSFKSASDSLVRIPQRFWGIRLSPLPCGPSPTRSMRPLRGYR